MRSRLLRRLCEGPRSLRREDGFSLVELTVATGVILTAVVMLGGVMTTGIKATGISRERQSATGLANQTMEQIRALPFDTMARGLARCVLPGALSAAAVDDALDWALRCDRQAYARRVREIIPSFDGAARLTAYLSRWLGGG